MNEPSDRQSSDQILADLTLAAHEIGKAMKAKISALQDKPGDDVALLRLLSAGRRLAQVSDARLRLLIHMGKSNGGGDKVSPEV
jgi:hypothetical protein